MCRCSSALGIARSSSGSRWRGMRSNARGTAGAKIRRTCAPARVSLLVGSGHLALDALDEEVDAAEELVVGDGVLGENFLAVVARDRSLPDLEGAVLETGLHLLDLRLQVGGNLVRDRDEVDRAFLDAPPRVLVALPRAVEQVARRLDVVRRPVDH